MRVLRGREPKGALDQDLARCRFEQIAAPYHFADPLFGVVHDHRQVVGGNSVRTQHYEITDLFLQTLGLESLDRVAEPDARGADA